MSENKQPDGAQITDFEHSMEELENLVTSLESGDLSLEASLETFEKGIRLTKTCQQQLDNARHKVSLLVDDGENMHLENFEHSDNHDA